MLVEFKSVHDVCEYLPTEAHARRFLEKPIWHDEQRCTHCGLLNSGEITGSSTRSGLYQCRERACRGQFTITTRSPLHATELGLRVWIAALFLVTTSSKGISSVVLGRILGLSQITAWKLRHAIREMMDRHGEKTASRILGTVVVDQAFVGGLSKFRRDVNKKRGTGTSKPQIFVAVQRNGEVRSTLVANAKRITIGPLVKKWIHPSATLMTDGAKIYDSVGWKFATHHKMIQIRISSMW